jgi:hypothetical protein
VRRDTRQPRATFQTRLWLTQLEDRDVPTLLTPIVNLNSNNTLAVYGQAVSFSAFVLPTRPTNPTPTGQVTFWEDGTIDLGTETLSSGFASLNTSALLAGSHSISATYGGDSNYTTGSASLNQSISQAPLTIMASSINPTYGDGTTLSGTTGFSTMGLIGSDTVSSVSLSTNAPTSGSGNWNVGDWSITPSSAVGSGLSNYSISYMPGMLTVSPAMLTIMATSVSPTYGDGTTLDPSAGFSVTGLISGDTLNSVSLSTNASTSSSGNWNVGNWSITPSNPVGSGLSNYSIMYANGTLTVSQLPVTVTGFTVADKVYDGMTTATITSPGTLSGTIPGDDVGLDTSEASASFTNPNVGPGRPANGTGYMLTGVDAGNYVVMPPSTTASITSSDGTTIFTDTYDWNGVASVKVTVTQATPDAPYLWDYNVTNESFTNGIATFALPEEAGLASNLQNTLNWSGSVGTLMGDPQLISWQANSGQPTLGIRASADFTFTTAPTGLALTNGIVSNLNLNPLTAGLLAIPINTAPSKEVLPLWVKTSADVDSTTGDLSLRGAMKDVISGMAGTNKIVFSKNLAGATITITEPLPTVTMGKTISIDGTYQDGPNQGKSLNITVARDATKGFFGLMNVAAGATATVNTLTFTGGNSVTFGGAIFSEGNLTLQNCVIHDNEGMQGGGIYAGAGNLTIQNCQIYSNTANMGGGGVYIKAGTLTIDNSAIYQNKATGGANGLGVGNGGGVETGTGVTNALITNSSIYKNTAVTSGGGIMLDGSNKKDAAYKITLSDDAIYQNTAQFNGGGVATASSGALQLEIQDDTWIYNNAAANQGGGLYFGTGVLSTDDSTLITQNGAPLGGGLYQVKGTLWLVMGGTIWANLLNDITVGP